MTTPLLSVSNLRKHYPLASKLGVRSRSVVHAVDGVSFEVYGQEVLGIVGESGCGKSTTGRLLMRLTEPDSGQITYKGAVTGGTRRPKDGAVRHELQMVFQDSYGSLNPRMSVGATVAFGPWVGGMTKARAAEAAAKYLHLVGLAPDEFANRYPHELSGGQRQRVNIARALAMAPSLVILDEPVSALDKSVEAQILNLLVDLQLRLKLTYIFISHDLNVIHYLSDRLLVMYLGTVVEIGSAESIYSKPAHPYTRALLAARPSMDPSRRFTQPPIAGDPPTPIDPAPGCRFATRCPYVRTICKERQPSLQPIKNSPHIEDRGTGRQVACHMIQRTSDVAAAEW